MAKIGNGYGSEWHLLRFLGRHRTHLDRAILSQVPGQRLEWLDFEFDRAAGDRELSALSFLPGDHTAARGWSQLWPARGTAPTWDAVARIDGSSWLLVEAKANVQELRSQCGAKDERSAAKIGAALSATQARLGGQPGIDWKRPFYQLANRLVVLEHLLRHGEDAHLLLIYFCGDRSGPGRDCPSSTADWAAALEEQEKAHGLPRRHAISDHVHKLFLDVSPPAAT
jgi:hypothetical protein